jgi:hypothetical protein
MDASRSRCGRWPNPVRDSIGQHDNAVRSSFRLTRGATRLGRHTPLGHDPTTVRWRKWIMPRGLVRAVGIEPTLLAERDFESRASTNSTTPALRDAYSAAIKMRNVKSELCSLFR